MLDIEELGYVIRDTGLSDARSGDVSEPIDDSDSGDLEIHGLISFSPSM